MNQKHLGLKLDEELIRKLRYVAAYEGYSMSELLRRLIRECIRRFEVELGEIEEL